VIINLGLQSTSYFFVHNITFDKQSKLL